MVHTSTGAEKAKEVTIVQVYNFVNKIDNIIKIYK